jgi:N-carbamoyl-D-amino-acid hydrolase
MSRIVHVGAAQMGPIALQETRPQVVERLLALLREGARRGCDLVVFPELCLTTFFPRWFMTDQEIDRFFEAEMPGPETRPLFEEAKRLKLGFCLGYAELAREGGRARRFNTAILVEKDGRIAGKYRKIHLPGHAEREPQRRFQHLEKRYFEVGDLGFRVFDAFGGRVGMCICNDRRWPETYRVMGLQGVELIVLGYNTPAHNPPAPEHDDLGLFHNQLVMQAGAYQNATWVVGVAKCGDEEGVPMIGGSQIVAPSGQTAAQASTLGDELFSYACDLDLCRSYKTTVFDFARHRRPEHYRLIVETAGPVARAAE